MDKISVAENDFSLNRYRLGGITDACEDAVMCCVKIEAMLKGLLNSDTEHYTQAELQAYNSVIDDLVIQARECSESALQDLKKIQMPEIYYCKDSIFKFTD